MQYRLHALRSIRVVKYVNMGQEARILVVSLEASTTPCNRLCFETWWFNFERSPYHKGSWIRYLFDVHNIVWFILFVTSRLCRSFAGFRSIFLLEFEWFRGKSEGPSDADTTCELRNTFGSYTNSLTNIICVTKAVMLVSVHHWNDSLIFVL